MDGVKHKILIIDDDEFLLDMYAVKFKEEGFEVETARGGKEALDKIKGGASPEVVLLDVVMPGMDGFELLGTIRKENLIPASKIIILSNLGQKEHLDKGMSLGAADYIVKAYFTPSEVVKKVNELILTTIKEGASDLHLTAGRHPTIRVSGSLIPLLKNPVLSAEDAEGLILSMLGEKDEKIFKEKKEFDFFHSFEDKAKAIKEVNLPGIFAGFAQKEQGFFLGGGPIGHGKSTTLASMIETINHTSAKHIITIEDPMEYLFVQDKSIVDQREVRTDTADFKTALRSMFRQDVNVAMIGE